MDRFLVSGGARLAGEVSVSGAKNSVLKLMAAALLAEGTTVLTDVPDILDVDDHVRGAAPAGLRRRPGPARVAITVPERAGPRGRLRPRPADPRLHRVLGPLVARCGEAKVALPGGDAIGSRGLDMHVAGLVKLGADGRSEHGYLIARGAAADRRDASGSTSRASARPRTCSWRRCSPRAPPSSTTPRASRRSSTCARCSTRWARRSTASARRRSRSRASSGSRPVEHATVPDRIVAGTWAVAAVMTRGDVTVRGGRPEHLEIALDKLVQAGADVDASPSGFRVVMDRRPRAVDVVTLPYPGLPDRPAAA